MVSLRTLKTFLAVVRHGTFAAAGDEAGLSAAAIGLQIRTLERALGEPLFDRSGRAVVLNTAGRNAVPPIEEIVARLDALVAGHHTDDLSGTIEVGAIVSALMGAFADALWTLKGEHPQLDVRLFAGLSSDFARKVEHGELDAAIVSQSPRPLPARLAWTPLYREPMVMVVPKRPHFALAAKPLDVLRSAPFIRFDREAWTGHLVKRALAQCSVTVRDAMELNSVEAIVELVRQGFGVSIVPKLANVHWARDRALAVVRLPGVDVERHVGLLERRRHGRMRFTAAIKAYFGAAAGTQRKTAKIRPLSSASR
jgi:DNA-binding transcriptional LysR family regulator